MIIAATQNASNFVAGVDLAFVIILGISIFFLIALTIVMLVFIRKYRRDKHPKAIQNEGSTKLEIIWTVIPLFLVLLMFLQILREMLLMIWRQYLLILNLGR